MGVGTELERIYSWFVQPTKTCGNCAEAKKVFDSWSIPQCKDRIEEIITRVQENAKDLGYNIPRSAIRVSVNLAIYRASRMTL